MKYETIVCPFCGNGHAHITYEENRVYQMNCPDCHNAIFHRDTSWDNAVSFFKRMVVTDESTLRQQETVANRNEPLTLEELRDMPCEPVYIVVGCASWWDIVSYAGMEYLYLKVEGSLPFRDYGKNWTAYRQKPEEDDNEV